MLNTWSEEENLALTEAADGEKHLHGKINWQTVANHVGRSEFACKKQRRDLSRAKNSDIQQSLRETIIEKIISSVRSPTWELGMLGEDDVDLVTANPMYRRVRAHLQGEPDHDEEEIETYAYDWTAYKIGQEMGNDEFHKDFRRATDLIEKGQELIKTNQSMIKESQVMWKENIDALTKRMADQNQFAGAALGFADRMLAVSNAKRARLGLPARSDLRVLEDSDWKSVAKVQLSQLETCRRGRSASARSKEEDKKPHGGPKRNTTPNSKNR